MPNLGMAGLRGRETGRFSYCGTISRSGTFPSWDPTVSISRTIRSVGDGV